MKNFKWISMYLMQIMINKIIREILHKIAQKTSGIIRDCTFDGLEQQSNKISEEQYTQKRFAKKTLQHLQLKLLCLEKEFQPWGGGNDVIYARTDWLLKLNSESARIQSSIAYAELTPELTVFKRVFKRVCVFQTCLRFSNACTAIKNAVNRLLSKRSLLYKMQWMNTLTATQNACSECRAVNNLLGVHCARFLLQWTHSFHLTHFISFHLTQTRE